MSVLDAKNALEAEVSLVQDRRVVDHIRSLLLPEPRPSKLAWAYGEPQQTFDGWIFLQECGVPAGIAYCEDGFGPKAPWGLVYTNEDVPDMGMDSGWYRAFMEAYFESAASELDIWRVVRRRRAGDVAVYLSAELAWDTAWKEVMRLRQEDPSNRYDCEHSIR